MHKVTKIEIKKDKNGNDMKVTTFEGVDKPVYVNSKYDAQIYADVEVGKEFEVVDDGNFKKIKYEKKGGGGSRSGMIERTMNKKAEQIKTAQDNKEESIRLASCNGGAVQIVASIIRGGKKMERAEIETELKYWKAYLYTRWNDVDVEAVTPFDN